MQMGGMRFFWPWEQQAIQANIASIQLVPGGGAPPSIALKLAGAAVLSAGATWALMGGAKQYLEQKQQATPTASTGGYTFNVEKGGTVTLTNPKTGEATAQTEQTQKGELTQPDFMQWLLLGGLGIGALYVLTRRKK